MKIVLNSQNNLTPVSILTDDSETVSLKSITNLIVRLIVEECPDIFNKSNTLEEERKFCLEIVSQLEKEISEYYNDLKNHLDVLRNIDSDNPKLKGLYENFLRENGDDESSIIQEIRNNNTDIVKREFDEYYLEFLIVKNNADVICKIHTLNIADVDGELEGFLPGMLAILIYDNAVGIDSEKNIARLKGLDFFVLETEKSIRDFYLKRTSI